MRIGLLDIDCHASKKKWGATIYPNIALAKIARYYKSQGHDVEWAIPFSHYDIIFRSKIFNFSADDMTIYDADKVIKGGTGYDVNSALPHDIDHLQPDYSIYPHVPQDTAYGFLTRGCPNKCKWCVVPRKEGIIKPYMDVDEIAIEGRKNLVLMGNNILASGDYAVEQLEKIIRYRYKIDFNQAMDARLVDDKFAKLLAKCRCISLVRFGCDTHAQIEDCERARSLMREHGYKGEFFLYTMLNDNYKECYDRITYWWKRSNEFRNKHEGGVVYAYAQPFRDTTNPHRPIPQWQKDMAGWTNKRMLYWTTPLDEFKPRQGFIFNEYNKIYG